MKERIDGRLRPVSDAPPLLSSSQSAWNGFLLERDINRAGQAQTIFYPHTMLVLVSSGGIALTDASLKRQPRFLARSGSVTLWPAEHESKAIQWSPQSSECAATEMVRVQLDLSLLERGATERDAAIQQPLAQQAGIVDSTIGSLVSLMEAEIRAGCPAGRLYGESLSLALAAHVAHRYGRGRPGGTNVTPTAGALSLRQQQRVQDYILGQLGGDLSLGELAAVAGLSPRYFVVAFRKATGRTPHQYVLQQRIEKARALLRSESTPIAELALRLGFSSQSHFTDTFHRTVGLTPARYRQAC